MARTERNKRKGSQNQANHDTCFMYLNLLGGDVAQEVRAVVWGLPVRSHPGRVEVSLSKTPNLTPDCSWRAGWYLACQSPLVCEWVNERHKLYSALDKGAI